MKKILIRVVIALVVLFIVAVVAVFFSLDGIVKHGVEKVGPMVTKVDVKLGAAEISPFSGSGRLVKLVVGNPEGFKAPSAISVGDAKLGVQVGSVFSDVVVINEIAVKDAEITLEGSLQGNNLTKLLDNINGSNAEAGNQPKPKGAPPEPGASKSSKKFIVKDFVLEGTKVNVSLDIPIVGHQSMTLPLPALHLQNIGEAEHGVTAEQLTMQIVKPVVSSVITAATEQVGKLGGNLKDVGKGGLNTLSNGIGNATKGITDLFKKK